MSDYEMYGAEQDWVCPQVGDLVEVRVRTFRKQIGVVVKPNDYITDSPNWCQVLLDNGTMKVYPVREVRVISEGTEE